MEKLYSMIRFSSVKNNYDFNKRLQHNLRLYQDNRITNNSGIKNYDLEKMETEIIKGVNTKESKILKEEMPTLNECIKEHKKLKKGKYRKEKHTTLAEGIIGFSEGINEDYENNKEEFDKRIFNFIEEFEELHQTKILNIVLHTDEEGNIHLHFIAKNYNQITGQSLHLPKKSKSNIKNQDLIAKHFHDFGKGYQRGESKSKKRNLNVEDYKENAEYEKKLKQIEKEKETIEYENIKLKATNKDLKETNEALSEKVEEQQKEIKELIQKRSGLESQYIQDITIIIDDLNELGKTEDSEKFLKAVYRYSKNEGREKLNKLLNKYKKGLEKVERRTTERITEKPNKKKFM